jgi:hypothetical protein
MDKTYIVTVRDTGNITDDPRNIHTILTSKDFIAPRERVEVRAIEPIPLTGARSNPSFSPELEQLIRETVVRYEHEERCTVVAMLPVKKNIGRNWVWDGFILVEADGGRTEFDINGMGVRATAAFAVPR